MKGVREESGKLYYNVKQFYNSNERKYVLRDHVILLKRCCCKAKSLMILKYFAMVIQHREFHERNHT